MGRGVRPKRRSRQRGQPRPDPDPRHGLVFPLAAPAPIGRPAAAQEIGSAISYLAGDEASFVHGAILDVDGGRNAA
jgi:NAD(P)-dependent dehydrogenase (short-subunit alcohol dehydrogenase family)